MQRKTAEDFDKWLRYVWEDFLYAKIRFQSEGRVSYCFISMDV